MKTRIILAGLLLLSSVILVVLFVSGKFTISKFGSSIPILGRSKFDTQELCPITQPQEPLFIPPTKLPVKLVPEEQFWYGSEELWTLLQADGVWDWLPYHKEDGGHYINKVVWWNKDYDWQADPVPEFTLTAHRLDDPSIKFKTSKATNAYEPSYGSMILIGVEIPTAGCWQLTGQYGDAQLSFVVWVTPTQEEDALNE